MRKINPLNARTLIYCSAVIMLGLLTPFIAIAAVDLADSPIAMNRDNAALVKPNIAFIVDDSGSMNDQNMPGDDGTNKSQNCWGWYNYNTLAYNPNYTYRPPYHPDTTRYPSNRFPNANFTAALEDGYFPYKGVTFSGGNDTNVRRDLSKRSNLPNTSYYYTTLPNNHASFDSDACLGDGQYTRITDHKDIRAPGTTPGSADALQNYANWYSYYRRRAYLMKAATGEAFRNLDSDNYRVGLFFINSNQSGAQNTSGRNNDLKINDFRNTHRTNWYDRLYGNRGNGWTPLRGALARVGRMYAGQFAGWDPVQYSCQQNFALLSTDGYWNTNGETTSYRALQVNAGGGTTQVGDFDGKTVNENKGTPLSAPYVDNNNVSNTLADIALYYYNTDLRNKNTFNNCTNRDQLTTNDVCEDNVKTSGDHRNEKQHMVTYTLGLGVDGTLPYDVDYVDGPAEITNGLKSWPSPSASDPAKIDDLWHAAVNGRGRYFSAKDPTTLTEGLEAALAKMAPQSGNAAAAASSSLEQGEDRVYVALYRTEKWDGDVEALDIDPNKQLGDNVIRPPAWRAQQVLDARSADDRRILYLGTNNELKSFTFSNLSSDGKGDHFSNVCSKSPRLAQCGTATGDLSSTAKTLANNGTHLVNYLRGSNEYEIEEGNDPAKRLYRDREHKLGDIVHSNPEYVKLARFNYADPTYTTFKTAMQNRKPMLYVGANDGMLHAFDAVTGKEEWAYVPGMIMPKLWQLADRGYQHRYFVDGTVTVADICTNVHPVSKQCISADDWRTLLVGGLGKGGCGYYALDITNPDTPVGLWEVSSNTTGMQNLGFSYGNPLIAMNKAGEWVVIFSSGYNNIPGDAGCAGNSGDGNGHVYVVNAKTGTLKTTIPTLIKNADASFTPAGTTSAPTGLGRLNAWINDPTVPVADRVYGGDLRGNVWRIDFDGNYNHGSSVRLAVLKDSGGNLQPITTKPELGFFQEGTNAYNLVMVGTGKLLGISDMSDVSQQSLYAIKDKLEANGVADVRSGSLTRFGMMDVNGVRKLELAGYSGGQSINWSLKDGWLVDFNPQSKSPGERVNVNMELLNYEGKLELWFGTNVPLTNPCMVGGYAIEYLINPINPMGVEGGGSNVGKEFLSTFFTGMKAHIADKGDQGTVRYRVVTGADGSIRIDPTWAPPEDDDEEACVTNCEETPSTVPMLRRTAWREIVD